jgi:hypothetical protein
MKLTYLLILAICLVAFVFSMGLLSKLTPEQILKDINPFNKTEASVPKNGKLINPVEVINNKQVESEFKEKQGFILDVVVLGLLGLIVYLDIVRGAPWYFVLTYHALRLTSVFLVFLFTLFLHVWMGIPHLNILSMGFFIILMIITIKFIDDQIILRIFKHRCPMDYFVARVNQDSNNSDQQPN